MRLMLRLTDDVIIASLGVKISNNASSYKKSKKRRRKQEKLETTETKTLTGERGGAGG